MNSKEIASVSFDREKFNTDYSRLTKITPGIIKYTVPDKESKERAVNALFRGKADSFHQEYPMIEALSREGEQECYALASSLLESTRLMPGIEGPVYKGAIETKILSMELVSAMRDYNEAKDGSAEKEDATKRFMAANIKLYGEPDRGTYQSLLSEKIAKISQKNRSFEAEEIFSELKDILPAEAFDASLAESRFRPSDETVQWMNRVVHSLCDDMLRHVPKTDGLIGHKQLRDIFQAIVDEEFEDEEWTVELGKATAIKVAPASKRIVIPFDRQPVTAAEARRLVVHELGIHVLTAMTGSSTTLKPLGRGLAGYADTQEGLGKVAEQALEGEFKEAGVDHYITAGLAYFDGRGFVDAYEAKWRMKLLEELADGEVPTSEQVEKCKRQAIDGPGIATIRIFRGTDELPLFKDLSYYNGSVEVWKYLESICDDDLQLNLLLAGKISTSKEHQRIILESASLNPTENEVV